MTNLVVTLKLTADGTDLVQELRLDTAELQKLTRAAEQADLEARRAATGFGTTETAIRQAGTAARAYTGETRAMADAIAAYDARLDGMRTRFNPFVAAQRDYHNTQLGINKAVSEGGITQLEGTRALERSRAAYASQLNSLRAATAATRSHTGAVRLQSYQMTNLGYQIQDIGTQLAMGTNPFLIMAQQGPQMTSAMGGVRNSLALVTPYFTATRVAVAGTTAAVLAGAAAWKSYLSSIKEVESASQGKGRILGISPGDLEDIAGAGAEAAGISRKTARQAETAFLNTGRIGKETMLGLISISKDYANLIGSDVNSAIDDLAEKFADPVKGAEELQKAFQLLDDKSAQYVRTLVDQNRTSEAQLILMSALGDRASAAAERLTFLERKWNDVGKAASDVFDALGRGINQVFDGVPASQSYLDQLTHAREVAQRSFGGQALLEGVGILDLNELDSEILRVRSKLRKLRADAASDELNKITVRAGDVGRQLEPGDSQLRTLREQQADLNAVLHDQQAAARVDNLAQVANGYDRVTHAIETYLTPAERARQSDELAIKALNARSPAEKAAIAEQQKRLELAGQTITRGEAEAQVIRAGMVARVTATTAITTQNIALEANTRATLDVAAATMESASAAERARARRQGLSEALQNGANATTQAQLQLNAAIAAQAETSAQAVADISAQADAQARFNEAVSTGALTQSQANAKGQAEAALRQLLVARSLAEGDAKAQLTTIIDALSAAYDRLNAEQARSAALDTIAGQKDELASLELQARLIGQTAQARAVSTAVLQAEQQARRAGTDLNTSEGQGILANAAKIAETTLLVERQQDAYDSLTRVGTSALDKLTDDIAQNKLSWTSLADVATSAIQDIIKQLAQLGISNEISNALFGTNKATLSDVGGILGGLFHGGGIAGEPANQNRIVPTSTFAHAQRRHSGGLAANEVPIIALKGEEVVTEDNPRHINNIGKAGRGRASGSVIINNYQAPGTKSEVKTRQASNGDTIVDVMTYQIKKSIAEDIASGQGDITQAMAGRFALNPSATLRRGG